MSKLLATRLPIAQGTELSSDTYNRLVRVLEINLGEFDPDNTRQIDTTERDTLFFNPGSIIWNTSIGVLQVYTGSYWAHVGEISVKTNGVITINLGSSTTGWDIERFYS